MTDGQSSRCPQKSSIRPLLRLSRRASVATAGVTAAVPPPKDGRRDRHRALRAAAALPRNSRRRCQKRDRGASRRVRERRLRAFSFFQRRAAHSFLRVSRLTPSRPAALAQESRSGRLRDACSELLNIEYAEHSSTSRPARLACPLSGGGIGSGREPPGRVHWVAGRAPPHAELARALWMSSAVALTRRTLN